jgi:alginate O-acetyltransferase complex protein AlgI
MSFISPIFLFSFLPLFLLVYYLAPGRVKLFVGIFGSLVFYAWGYLVYIPLILLLMLFTYLAGLGIARWRQQKISLTLFRAGVLLIVVLLVVFKLLNEVKFPLGLSFVTFQAIAYLWEVYNKKVHEEKNLVNFSFYLLLFPKFPVGPITRYSQLEDQIRNLHVDVPQAADGLRRFITGLAKKVLIADTLAKVVTPVFNLSAPSISPAMAWLVIISFSLQLFFDFSGYTDMAIGIGRMMGLKFVENFNYPYISKSIGEFWRRWHISLSSWFRDLVFYPLERHRLKWMGQQINILIVFLLTGLWHGFTANFIIWGLLQGVALIFEGTFWGRKLRGSRAPLQHLYALGVILVGWVFFRSPSVSFAWMYLGRLLGNGSGVQPVPFELTSPLPFIEPTFVMALIAGVILSLPVNHFFDRLYHELTADKILPALAFRIMGDVMLVLLLLVSIAAMAGSAFMPGIYELF